MLKMGLRWVVGILMVVGLSGCGQTGPLVMPPKEEPVKTSQTPSAEPATETTSETPSK